MRHFFSRLFGRSADRVGDRDADEKALIQELRESDVDFTTWLARLGSGKRLYGHVSTRVLDELKDQFPAHVSDTIDAAQAVLDHRFDLLGSGPYTPRDPDRSLGEDGYAPIDWYIDPVRNLRFPTGVPYKEWDLYEMRPGLADIKYPWELARCQHWVVLGQACRLTGDDRFARELFHQLDDFMEANPVGIGINWTCTMDVAIRALNWAIGLQLVSGVTSIPSQSWQRAYEALFDHGIFIFDNLENNYEVTSNHFLSNVVGLYFLSAVFMDTKRGEAWSEFSRDALEEEIQVQILDDGADYESSIPYHRLVLESFLTAARLADFLGHPLSDEYSKKLTSMVEYLIGVIRPDGLMPQFGDADDGRIHIFTKFGSWTPQDARHLLVPAGLLLDRPEWCPLGGEEGLWEAAWWGQDISLVADDAAAAPENCTLYPQAGHAVVRKNGTYLLMCNGIVGTKGFGNHKHNDQLSFEFHADGQPLLVDPGSYVYTSDPDARNLFRGTGYHNTLIIDGEEQNELRPDWLFRLFETAEATHVEFEVAEGHVDYQGKHIGYQRLESGVVHDRRFRLLRESNIVLIADRLTGSGSHHLTWHFHAAPDVALSQPCDGHCLLKAEGTRYRLVSLESLEPAIGEGWFSPSYGVRTACQTVDFKTQASIDGEAVWMFALVPEAEFTSDPLNERLDAWRAALLPCIKP